MLEIAASGARARKASVNESSGAGWRADTVRTIMARSSSWDVNLTVAKRCFPLLPEVKIEWAQVWRARRPREELDFALFQKRLGVPAGV